MKNIRILGFLLLFLGCTKDLERINTDPNGSPSIRPEVLFSTAQLQATLSGRACEGAELTHAACYIQYFSSLSANWPGDKYLFSRPLNDAFFEDTYLGAVKTLAEVLNLTRANPEFSNLYAAARIMRVVVMHRLTDAYGDVPYAEAGLGDIGRIQNPRYDAQREIYLDFFAELEAACSSVDVAKNVPGDLIYEGNAVQWKKFGYTLMLRLAIRVAKKDPILAQTWAQKAIAGGVMEKLEDCAFIRHQKGNSINVNQTSAFMAIQIWSDPPNVHLTKTLVDDLMSRADSRIRVLQANNPDFPTPRGMPHGLDIPAFNALYQEDSLALERKAYSVPNPIFFQEESPTVFQTFAEAQLLLADVALRGWTNTPNSAEEHFSEAVKAGFEQWNYLYADVLAVSGSNFDWLDAEAEAFSAAHPLPTDVDAARQEIAREYWLVNFTNPLEAWAYQRATDLPRLTPGNYPFGATNGAIPSRMVYPTSEKTTNEAQVSAAINRQGADLMTTKIWWDVE